MPAGTTYQVKTTLQEIFTPGVSRHTLKKQGLAHQRITSNGTMKTYQKTCSRFARWCKQRYDTKLIGRITPTMARAYITELRDNEAAGSYLDKIQSAVRKLDTAMKYRGWRDADAPDLLETGWGWRSDYQPERRYTPDQAEAIIDNLADHARDAQATDVAKLQTIAGLRISEAVQLRAEDIDPENCTIRADRGTKGGRPREITVDDEHREYLADLRDRAEGHEDGHVFRGRGSMGRSLKRRVQDAVRHACDRLGIECFGTHGFRKSWAQERFGDLRDEGLDREAAGQRVAEQLGHNRTSILKSYLTTW